MKKNASQLYLTPLQETLHRLQKQPIPEDLRSELQVSLKHLEKLKEYMAVHLPENRLGALYSVSQALGTSLDLDEVLNQVMDAVIFLTGAERGFLLLLEPDPGKEMDLMDGLPGSLKLKAARNFEGEALQGNGLELSRAVVRSVLEGGQSVVTTNTRDDARFSRTDSVVYNNLLSILCTPMRARGRIIGVIYVDNRGQSGLFSAEDINLLDAFAAQAAMAIENARLYTSTDQALTSRVAELEILSQIDSQLNSSLDLEHVLEITRLWAVKGTQADQGSIALFNNDRTLLSMAAGPQTGSSISFDDPLVSETLAAGVFIGAPSAGGEKLARLAALLRVAKEPLGILMVTRKESFPEEALLFLERLSRRAANKIENARLYQAVQDANRAKSKFVSVVTHELRIPMTSIRGYADLLRQGSIGPLNEMQAEFLTIIRNNVDRMSTLVSDLADISRLETGRLKLTPSLISLAQSIEETLQSLRPRFEEKNQCIEIDAPQDMPPVYADPSRVVQVMTNLLSNACKYTPVGGKILVRACPGEVAGRLEITDNGIGISDDDQRHLFTQFFRSEDARVREQQGWGLGLSIAKSLVEAMDGQIGFTSELSQGSTFWFSLPTRQGESNENN